jgi:hypothetical protein
MGAGRNLYGILVGKPEGKRHLEDQDADGRMGSKWTLGRLVGGVEWIHLAQDRDRWRAVVNAVMNLRVLVSRTYLVFRVMCADVLVINEHVTGRRVERYIPFGEMFSKLVLFKDVFWEVASCSVVDVHRTVSTSETSANFYESRYPRRQPSSYLLP